MKSPAPVKAAEDRLSALLDAAVDGMILIDPQGRVSRFNRAAEKLFGYAAAEVLGKNVNVLMPAPYHADHDGYLARYRTTGERRIIGIGREVMAQRADGSTFPIDLSVGEFRSGDEHGFVGILRDISERHRQTEELRRRSDELRLIVDNAPTAILITDPAGHITSANQACAALLGYSAGALALLRHSELVHPDDRAGMLAALEESRAQGAGMLRRDLRYLRSDGSTLHALLYSAVARDDAGQPLLVIAEIVDRSALAAATHEAESLRGRLAHVTRIGTLGEMVSGIAHELNQPLTAIASYASACRLLLESGAAQPADLAGPLGKIAEQAERAGHVIRGLRNLVRRSDPVRELLDVNALVREVLRLVDFELKQSGIRLRADLAAQLPAVSGDGVQVQQVVLNMIRNGLEAMQDRAQGDTIEVRTSLDAGDFVQIRVADSGPGVPADVVPRLFEPFFTTKARGFGLGLSICKSIAVAHRGDLEYLAGPGKGATFALKLPAGDGA